AYRQNELQDNLLVQAGEEETSLDKTATAFDEYPMTSKEETLPINTVGVKDSAELPNYPVKNVSDFETSTEPFITETVLPMEEVETSVEQVVENKEITETIEHVSLEETPSSPSPSPVTQHEAKQLEKEISHLRQEAYSTPELEEEQPYETT